MPTSNTTWSLFDNFIDKATADSRPKAIEVSQYHDEALQADSTTSAYFLALYTAYHPFHLALVNANTAADTSAAVQHGNVDAVGQLLGQMTANVNNWDATIQTHYAKSTSRYKALFLNGHAPFTNGSQNDRIAAVATLLSVIGTDAALATIKATIQTYYNALTAAQNTKNTSKDATNTSADAFETARVNMCAAQLGDYGSLINHFSTNPQAAAKYFNEANLRNIQQTDYTGSLNPAQVKFICERTLAATRKLHLYNTGEVSIRFYSTTFKDDSIGAVFQEVAPHADMEVLATQLGTPSTQHFIHVLNVDPSQPASYRFVIE